MPFKWPINPAKKARQRKKIQEDNLRFWGAVASSVRLGWLGLIDRNKAQLTATTPALTREGEDEHTLSSEACADSRPLLYTADSPCSHPRATELEDNTALGQLTGKPAGAWPDYRSRWYAAQLTATTPALTREGEDEHTLSSEACADSRPLLYTADSPCSHPRDTESEDNTALGQLTGKPAGARPDYRSRWYAEKKVILQSLFPLLMCTAAMEGDIEGLEGHLNQGADAQMTSNYGRTPLHVAAGEGDLDTVRFLLKKGADISYRDDFREPALNDAIRSKNLEVVEHLVSEGAYLEILPGALGGEMCCEGVQSPCLKPVLDWREHPFSQAVREFSLHASSLSWTGGSTLSLSLPHCPLRDFHNNRPLEDARRLGFKYMEELLLADQARRQAVAEEEERLRELQAEIEKDAEELLQ
ncbi:UNVERIFIED_CONTAM: hypothetical protein FKN15_012511 [Acipenser sinensis]